MAVALAALDAQAHVTGTEGDRPLPVSDFYHPNGNVLTPKETITEIRVPSPATSNRQIFLKYRVRDSIDFAIVSVGVVLVLKEGTCSSARIVLGAVAPGPHRAIQAEELLSGKKMSDEAVDSAATAALVGAVPLSKNAYKIEIAKALVKRALRLYANGEN
jgi:xanthine dehydrogenase YagS FAD-binding subunit